MTTFQKIVDFTGDSLAPVTLERAEIGHWNRLAAPRPARSIDIRGKAFDVSMHAPAPWRPGLWSVQMTSALAQVSLILDPQALWATLGLVFPKLTDETPDRALAEILLGLVAEPALSQLGLAIGTDVQMSLFEASGEPSTGGGWTRGVRLTSGETTLDFTLLAAPTPGSLGFARRLLDALLPTNLPDISGIRLQRMRVPICICLGYLDILEANLSLIEVGGAVVPSGTMLSRLAGILLAGRTPLAAVSLSGNRATVTEMESDMTEHMARGASPDGALEELPIKLTFEIGHQTVELAELCNTAENTVYMLDGEPRDCPVFIKANGLPYAMGHLVTVGASLAVRIDSLVDDV